jgi:hypothetical protein
MDIHSVRSYHSRVYDRLKTKNYDKLTVFRYDGMSREHLGKLRYAYFGIGFAHPSNHLNFVEQLYADKQIPVPIITVRGFNVILVGKIDNQYCNEWTHFPASLRPEGGWTIEVEQLDLFGISFYKQLVCP